MYAKNKARKRKSYLLHHHLLTFPDKLILSLHYSLQKLEILHVLAVRLYAMHKVLYDLRVDFIAEDRVVLKNTTHRLSLPYTGIQEQIQLLVQQDLVLLIRQAKVLQEIVRQAHQFVHPDIFLGVEWHLQQIQDDSMHADVTQESLFVFARLQLAAQQR